MDTEGELTSSTPRLFRPDRRLHQLLGILALVGLLAALVAIAVGVGTQVAIAHTNDSFIVTRANLHGAEKTLRVLRGQLKAMEAQSTAAGITLAGESADLAKEQAALASAQRNVSANGVNISALDSCLSGIEQTLNQIAVDDDAGATSTLSSVQATCKSVHPSSS
jgi:hypothetical protein